MSMSNELLIEDYLDFYQHSSQSQSMRKSSLNYFFDKDYFNFRDHVFKITTKILKNYFVYLKNLEDLSLQTKKNKWGILISFLNYTMENYEEFLIKIPSKTISWRGSNGHQTNDKEIATIEEVQALLNYFKLYNFKHYLIFRLFVETGMRKGELINAKIGDLHLEKRYIKTRGKTDDVIYYFSKELATLLDGYYQKRLLIHSKDMNIFLSNRNTKYGLRSFNLILKHALNKIGIEKNITCHVFRRTLNTLRKKMGCSNEDRKILLNHKISDVNIEHYLVLNKEEYLKLFDTYNPYKNINI